MPFPYNARRGLKRNLLPLSTQWLGRRQFKGGGFEQESLKVYPVKLQDETGDREARKNCTSGYRKYDDGLPIWVSGKQWDWRSLAMAWCKPSIVG
jgi:hypothetical protein